MPDREKVIKALDEHLHCSGRGKSGYCPYSDDELWDDISDALALLKEQEAQKPNIMQDKEGIWTVCRKCGAKLWPMFGGWTIKHDQAELPKYCQRCGHAVKWNA